VVKVDNGQLYLLRPGHIRSDRECMYVLLADYTIASHISFSFNEAMVTIRRVPNVDHNFQLVVTHVYEDGDQEILEDEDESTLDPFFCSWEELIVCS
jgi:hypothetical protein